MNKENLQAELDGLKALLEDINSKIAVNWFNNNPQRDMTEFEAIDEFYSEVYDLQGRTVIQNRIDTPQELVGFDLLTIEEAEQIIKDALGNRGIPEVAELLSYYDDDNVRIHRWYCYDNIGHFLYNATQEDEIEEIAVINHVFDDIQIAING